MSTTLSQSVNLGVGDSVMGYVSWYKAETGFNDNAFLQIKDVTGAVVATPFLGNDGTGPGAGTWRGWMNWSFSPQIAGLYTVVAGATNNGDSAFSPTVFLDAAGDSIPEPATLLLFGTGLATIGLRRYRRRRS